jgi:hypothetical protein
MGAGTPNDPYRPVEAREARLQVTSSEGSTLDAEAPVFVPDPVDRVCIFSVADAELDQGLDHHGQIQVFSDFPYRWPRRVPDHETSRMVTS